MAQNRMADEIQVYADWLKRVLPEADRMMLGDRELGRVAAHCLKVRAEMPWGQRIPEEIFRSYVLVPRVNNEDPVFYHEAFRKEIGPQLVGLSMEEAIRAVNYWCYEKATYQSTDNRTANPLTIVRRAYGRCGEESVLLVSALRACGIPARQVYVPRWSHCDDNHAWVEAWADGKWHYMGACEPESELDSGWFTAAASKAMLVHARAYGEKPVDESVAGQEGTAWVINRTAAYANTTELKIRVTENGQPLEGVEIRFELLNGAEHFPIHTAVADGEGCASLNLGLGTVFLHVHDGKRYTEQSVKVTGAMHPVEIRFDEAVSRDETVLTIRQEPPEETKIQHVDEAAEVRKEHLHKMRTQEEKRLAYEASMDWSDRYLSAARGNGETIRRFLNDERFAAEEREALLDTLREKDFVDATEELLADALSVALPYKKIYPPAVWKESVLSPRVSNEMLYPDRAWLRDHGPDLRDGRRIWEWISDAHAVRDMFPPALIPRMRVLQDQKECSERMLDILFVNICRAVGVAARLNPVTGEKEIWEDGCYRTVVPQKMPDAALVLKADPSTEAQFDVNVSVALLEGGTYHTLQLNGSAVNGQTEIPVSTGQYRVICCTRQIDGSLDAYLMPAAVSPGEKREVQLAFPAGRTRDMIRHEPLEPLDATAEAGRVTLPGQQNPALIAELAPGEEPTEHLLNELLAAADVLDRRGISVYLIVDAPEAARNEKLRQVVKELKRVQLVWEADSAVLRSWRKKLQAGDLRLPLAMAVDAHGNGLFAFTNYHVGSVMALADVLTQ